MQARIEPGVPVVSATYRKERLARHWDSVVRVRQRLLRNECQLTT